MANGATLGQAAGPLLTFDDTNNYLEITGANVGIGTTTPIDKFQVAADNSIIALGESGGSNLIFNGGGEDGISGWTSRDFAVDASAGSGASTSAAALSGSLAFQATNDGGLNQTVEVIPSGIYTVTLRMRVNTQGVGDASQGYIVVGSTATGRDIVDQACNPNTYDANPNTNKWVHCSATFTAPAATDLKTSTVYVGFRAASSTHTVLVDNVMLSRGGVPQAYNSLATFIGSNGATALTGNVGIGTTNPGTKLEAYLPGTYNTQIISLKDSTHTMGFGIDSTATYWGGSVYVEGTRQATFENGGLIVGTTYAGANNAPASGLLVQGNVGIGDTGPTVKLKVAGDVEANNMIRATGWLTGTGTGLGVEIGVSASIGYVYSYDRTTSAYGTLNLQNALQIVGTGGTVAVTNALTTGSTINSQTISAAASFTGTVAFATLGTTNTATILCRNASNQLAGCNTLTVAQGGTGAGTLTGILIGNGTGAITATTVSSGISGQLSDETGSGALVFATSPALTTPTVAASGMTFGGGSTSGIKFAYGSVGETYSSQTTIIGNNVYVDSTDVVSGQVRYKNTHGTYGHTIYEQAAGVHTWYGQSASVTAGAVVTKVQEMQLNASGNLSVVGTVTGTTLNGTTGINTGAGAGTQRIDASGNLVNIGTITSGLINGQTISSAANFTGTVVVATDITTPYHKVSAAVGYGLCFWADCTNYKISMGNTAEYQYGPVSDYSIKMTMSNTAGRGFTWGIPGGTPIAALGVQNGNFQIAGTLTVSGASGTINGSTIYTAANDPLDTIAEWQTLCTNCADIVNDTTGTLTVARGGTGGTAASITLFNNITGYTATGATGTTSTNLVFSASPTFTGTLSSANQTITSASANALAIGLNGTTNPAFNVDASTASSATGLNIKSAAAAGGLALSVLSSGANENLTINAKGTGTITLGNVSTGVVYIGSGGAGKITVTTWDPPYTIGGVGYATYGAAMVGVREEVTGIASLVQVVDKVGYKQVIDFKTVPEGSDLWLFSRAVGIDSHIGQMSVLLTPMGNARAWYHIDKDNYTLTIYSTKPTEVSYRLSAPRFDADQWTNYNHDEGVIGLQPPSPSFPELVIGDPTAIDTLYQGFDFDVDLLFETISKKFEDTYHIVFTDGLMKIAGVIADKITTKELCLEDVCINKAQLQTIIANNPSIQSTTTTTTTPDGGTTITNTQLSLDTIPPTITLNGDSMLSLNVGDTYVEQGALAVDDIDGNTAVVISGDVDTAIPGVYTITYLATDLAGNQAISVTRTINVASTTTIDTTTTTTTTDTTTTQTTL
jgi:hypothetical protein